MYRSVYKTKFAKRKFQTTSCKTNLQNQQLQNLICRAKYAKLDLQSYNCETGLAKPIRELKIPKLNVQN